MLLLELLLPINRAPSVSCEWMSHQSIQDSHFRGLVLGVSLSEQSCFCFILYVIIHNRVGRTLLWIIREQNIIRKVKYVDLGSRFKVQGFFICHMINYTGYNQKWNVGQIRSAQWTVQRIKKIKKKKKKKLYKSNTTQEYIYIYI